MASKENNFPSSFTLTKKSTEKSLSLLTVGINVAKCIECIEELGELIGSALTTIISTMTKDISIQMQIHNIVTVA